MSSTLVLVLVLVLAVAVGSPLAASGSAARAQTLRPASQAGAPATITLASVHEVHPVVYRPRATGASVIADGMVFAGGPNPATGRGIGLAAYSARSLKLLWWTPGSPLPPAVGHGTVVQIGDGVAQAMRASDGKLLWQRTYTSTTAGPTPTPLIVGPRVFGVYDNGLAAYQRSTGDLLWQAPTATEFLRYSRGAVYATGYDGGAGYDVRTGAEVASVESTEGQFAVTRGVVYVAQDNEVDAEPAHCAQRCPPLWSYQAPDADGNLLEVAASHNRVFVSTQNGESVLELDAANGRLLRRLTLPSDGAIDGVASLQPLGHLLFVNTESAVALAFSAKSCGQRQCGPVWMAKLASGSAGVVATHTELVSTTGLLYRPVRHGGPFHRAAAPTGVRVTGQCNEITATWTAPARSGGLPVTGALISTAKLGGIGTGIGYAAISAAPGSYALTAANLTPWGTGAPTAATAVTVTGC